MSLNIKIPTFLLICTLPGAALVKLSQAIDLRIILSVIFAISVITYLAYWHDKRRAQTNGWRVPEQSLHLLELVGGWPAAYIAQQQFHHKTRKRSYQIAYWSIVVLYQICSIEILFNGQITLSILKQWQ